MSKDQEPEISYDEFLEDLKENNPFGFNLHVIFATFKDSQTMANRAIADLADMVGVLDRRLNELEKNNG